MRFGPLLNEAPALAPIRRALVITVLFVPWTQLGLTVLLNRDELSQQSVGFFTYTALYALVAAITSQRGFALMGPLLPASLLIVPWFIDGPSWINANVAAMAVVIVLSLVLRPLLAVLTAVLISGVYVALVQAQLPSVVITGATLRGGIFHVIQLCSVAVLVSYAWSRVNAEAQAYDAGVLATQRQLLAARLRQDRLAHWRRVSSRLHATVLELLRHAQVSGQVQAFDLNKEFSDLRDARLLREPLPGSVVADVASDFVGRLEVEFVADSSSAEIQTDIASAELLRDCLYEFCIAARHAGARRVLVHCRAFKDRIVFVFSDDAPTTTQTQPAVADFGMLQDRVKLAGASLALSNDSDGRLALTLVIPHLQSPDKPAQTADVTWGLSSSGERMISAILMAVFVAALPVAVFLQSFWPGTAVLAMVWALMCSGLLASFFLFKERINVWLSVLLAVVALSLMLLTASYSPNCSTVEPVHYIANSSGYALLAIFMLGNRVVASIAMIPWFVSVSVLMHALPDACESVAWYAVANTVMLVPIGLTLLYVSLNTFKKATEKSSALEAERDAAAQRDQMVHDVIDSIEVLLGEADALLSQLQTSPSDPTLLQRLHCVESQLRIRAQVDPLMAGATARGLIEFVDALAARGEWIEVGTIAGSQYQRELPAAVVSGAAFVASILGSGRKLNLLTTGQDELVTCTLTRAEAELILEKFEGWEMTNSGWILDDVQVDLDLAGSQDPSAPVLIVWSRPIHRVPGLGIPDRRAKARV